MLRQSTTLLLVLLVVITAGSALAQMTVTGAISGTVTDPAGQVVPSATVTLLNEKTGENRSATTNDAGSFSFPVVPPGTYSIKIEHAGFRTYQNTGVVLSANERQALGDIRLQIGTVSET